MAALLPKPRVLLILGDGFEEIEAITPWDILRRAGAEVVAASAKDTLQVTGSHAITVTADMLLEDAAGQAFDLVLLPGGPGVAALRRDGRVLDRIKSQVKPPDPGRTAGKSEGEAKAERQGQSQGKVAALCAAPLVLADAGVLSNRRITSFPSAEAELLPRVGGYSQDRVVFDGPVCTSRGAGTAEEFALALVAWLIDPEAAEAVRRAMVARA